MQAIQVTCPQCGATLRVSGGKDDVTCEYCGAVAMVQRRSQVLQRVLPPPMRPVPMPIAVQRRNSRGLAIGLVMSALMLAGIGVSAWVFVSKVRSAAPGGAFSTSSSDRGSWEGGGPAIVVGDRIYGRRRAMDPDTISIVALDASTGAEVWRSDKLGTYDETYQGTLAFLDNTLMFVSDRGKVTALDPDSGALRWTAALPEKPRELCTGAASVLVVVTADQVRRPIRVTDGQSVADPAVPLEVPTPPAATVPTAPAAPAKRKPPPPPPPAADAPPPTCTPVAADRVDRYADDEAPQELQDATKEWTGRLLISEDGVHVIVGRNAKGTNLPVLARVDGTTSTWRVVVPPDPMSASEGGTDVAGVGHGLACSTWQQSAGANPPPHATCVQLADGVRVWDTVLSAAAPLEGLQVTDRSVLISMWGLLEARDPKTGKLQWHYGEAF